MMIRISKAFVHGFSRAFDITGSMYRRYDLSKGYEKDLKALRGDWEKVGETIYKETSNYKAIKQSC